MVRKTLMRAWITATMRLLCNSPGLAPVHAGNSNDGIVPGTIANLAGKLQEWAVPTPRFARDTAIAPDGSVFVAALSSNKVVRFAPKSQAFRD